MLQPGSNRREKAELEIPAGVIDLIGGGGRTRTFDLRIRMRRYASYNSQHCQFIAIYECPGPLHDRTRIAFYSQPLNDLPRSHQRILHALRLTALCD